ncbi:FtsB family cell division protein [Paracoccus aerodenitrificans]|uniref:FtsB family cell division protein n=1 Tax=Paracoccus aerodenitrificans TaxID=3017781 RepID=UPI0022F01A1C|nr:septum formation initiator family protein [Paracoccus aerodenitrificans]WBU65264.1 septum formation initiator family protein [Paracoccus aerodenitrificans]
MSQRLSLPAIIIVLLAVLASLYFAFAAVQGPSGLMRRIQLEAETETLREERDQLQLQVNEMENLTRRLSDDYLDLDLLDERAREVLGLMRPDEVIIR